MLPEHGHRWQHGMRRSVPCGLEALARHAQPACHRWSTLVSVVASAAHPRAHLSKPLHSASRWTRRGRVDAARARPPMAAWADVLHAMRLRGTHRLCVASLASVECCGWRGCFSCASTSTPLQAAAHGVSMHAAVFGGDGAAGDPHSAPARRSPGLTRPGGARGPCPTVLTSVAIGSKRAGFS